jgi:hypothetical protein
MKLKTSFAYQLIACVLFFSSGKISAQVGFYG